jgi:cyclic-di-GMP phosphodiesterase TipF (flagellum assembly factor)
MSNADREIDLRGPLPARSRVRDTVIVVAMATVSLAFGAGLMVNGGFGFGPSLIGGLGLFVLSMFIHTMLRRLQLLAAERGPTNAAFAADASDFEFQQDGGLGRSAARGRISGEGDYGHGWGEPEAVNDLVRQLTTEMQKEPDSKTASPRVAPSLSEPQTARGPIPTKARPPGPELPPLADRTAPRTAPASASPAAVTTRDDLVEVLRRACEAEDIEIHLQPVMSIADRRTHLYEAFPRVRDGRGGLIRAETYVPTAANAGLLPDIERLAFRRTVQILGRLIERGKQRPIFCPLSTDALRDGTFLRAFHETLKAGPALASNLIFELAEGDLPRLGPAEREAVHALANAGFRFSLQDVMQLDMAVIGDLPVAFVKLMPIALSGQPGHAAGLVGRARSIGAEPVIDGVQDDRDLAIAQALGIVLGQGGYLSEPRPLKADVIGDMRTGT